MDIETELGNIDRFVADLDDGDPRLNRLLSCSIGRVLARTARRGERWLTVGTTRKSAHVADWLKAALSTDAHWLGRTDAAGRPLKLMKLGSVDQAVAEADKAMSRASQQGAAAVLREGDETVVFETADGWRIVRLLTPAALDRESAAMRHCVGNGAYDDVLDEPGRLILSLRDPRGRPHVTVEIDCGSLEQIQGRMNDHPSPACCAMLLPYLRDELEIDLDPRELRHVVDAAGAWHPVDALPPGTRIEGDLELDGATNASIPEGLTVSGVLNLAGSGVSFLPPDLDVGSLIVGDAPLAVLPCGMRIRETLNLSGPTYPAMEEGFRVEGDMNLSGDPIVDLPPSMSVGGHLRINAPNLSVLPAGLEIGGGLSIYAAAIEVLPENIRIGGNVHIRLSRIRILSKGLEIGGNLDLGASEVEEIGEDTRVGGDLTLKGSRILALPSRLTVGGDLRLGGSLVSAIGADLRVGGDVDMVGSVLETLPEDAAVAGRVLRDGGDRA